MIEYPVARTAAEAVSSPVGHARRLGEARKVAFGYLTGGAENDAVLDEISSRFTVIERRGYAPGSWKKETTVRKKWRHALDAHWAEIVHLIDGRIRLGITWFAIVDNRSGPMTPPERRQVAERLEGGISVSADQLAADFGLFAWPTDPAALDPGDYEIMDPLNAGVLLPDE